MRRWRQPIQSPGVNPPPAPAPADCPPEVSRAAPDVRALYCAHLDYVWHSLRRLGVPPKDLPDFAHDVFVAVARALPGYDPARPIRPWLFGVCFRVASDQLRLYRNTREVLGAESDPPDIGPSPEQALLDDEARQLVEDSLAALDMPHRAVLVMHDIGEHRAAEIAEVLEIPLKTVYSRLRTARLRFVAAARMATEREQP
jgi:RNA polymerase sigma-70 factor, ECF subfamily